MTSIIRYTEEDLQVFKAIIEKQLEKDNIDLNFFMDQIQDIAEVSGNKGDRMDDTSGRDLEFINSQVSRCKRHIQDLKNALFRIKNKAYGICSVTGELIDRRRLMAVPTTTKSLLGKSLESAAQQDKYLHPPVTKPRPLNKKKENVPPSKIIRFKPQTGPKDDLIDDDIFGDDLDNDELLKDGLLDNLNFEDDKSDLYF
jgi:RNA polymerase-binding transcription factor DksA